MMIVTSFVHFFGTENQKLTEEITITFTLVAVYHQSHATSPLGLVCKHCILSIYI